MAIATRRIYSAPDSQSGAQRLVAAPGDVVPLGVPLFDEFGNQLSSGFQAGGIISVPDPVTTALVPVPGYETMTEDEVLALLPTLADADRIALQDYERAHMARGSITRWGKTSRVVRGSKDPVPLEVPSRSLTEGYEAMSDEELQAALVERAIVTKASTRAGWIKALQAADAEHSE